MLGLLFLATGELQAGAGVNGTEVDSGEMTPPAIQMVPLSNPDVSHVESAKAAPSFIHHIVLVEFKQDVTSEQQEEVLHQAAAMLSEIPVVEEIYVGPKARQNRAVHIKNYDVAIYIRLQHEDDIDAYRSHKLHRRFLQQNKHKFAWIQVVDFMANSITEPAAEVIQPEPAAVPLTPELQTSTERLNP